MNINNQKLSCRQLGRLLFFDYLALPSLLLPQCLAAIAGSAGFICLLVGDVCGYVLLSLLLSADRIKNMQVHNCVSGTCGERKGSSIRRVGIRAAALLGLVLSLTAAAAALLVLAGIVCVYLLQAVSVWLVLFLSVLLVAYGLSSGTESRGRRYELLYTPVLAALLLFLLAAAVGMKPQRLYLSEPSPIRLLKGSGLAAVGQLVCLTLPLYAGRTEKATAAEYGRAVRGSFFCAALVQLLFYLVLTGCFGAPTVAALEYPVLELGAAVHVTAGFLERQDALLCSVWLIPLLAFSESMLHAAGRCVRIIWKGAFSV